MSKIHKDIIEVVIEKDRITGRYHWQITANGTSETEEGARQDIAEIAQVAAREAKVREGYTAPKHKRRKSDNQ